MEHRIVSLLPSATEIVAALGYRDSLVGRSHECDFPLDVQQLTICSEPQINVSGSSLEIDRDVKQAVRDALSIYSVSRHELERLKPTVVITQSQCDVCAVNLKDVEAAVCEMIGSRPEIVSLEPMDMADIWTDIRTVAESLRDEDAGERLLKSLQGRLKHLASIIPKTEPRPTVVCIEWLEPLMPAGNWVPELVELAGGMSLLSKAGQHSPWMTWEDLTSADPDIIAIMPCGFGIERTQREQHLLTEHPSWQSLKAVGTGNVFLTDGNQYFNRPGPRLVESAEILAEILHPELAQFGHQGHGWIKY